MRSTTSRLSLRWSLPLCGLAAALLTACPDREISRVPLDPDSVEHLEIPSTINGELDVLFVIDNSISMQEEQDSLIENFRLFTGVLSTIEGGLPSIRIGVVTSDVGTMGGQSIPGEGGCDGFGDNGVLQMRPGLATAPFLENLRDPITGARTPNYTGSLEEAFSQIANVGDDGCGFEAHLASMQRALRPEAGNGGFLRPNAHLAVIFIADEDDCSIREDGVGFFAQTFLTQHFSSYVCFRTSTVCEGITNPNLPGPRRACRPAAPSLFHPDISVMANFLRGLKQGDEDKLIVAGIIGDARDVAVSADGSKLNIVPSCEYGTAPIQKARPAIRLDAFIRSFRNHAVETICAENLSGALRRVSEVVADTVGRSCLDGYPAKPLTCSVLDVTDPRGPGRRATVVPQCDQARSRIPCWHLEEDEVNCAITETHLALRVDRGGALPEINSAVVADCVTTDVAPIDPDNPSDQPI
jgi:hypothetical protein